MAAEAKAPNMFANSPPVITSRCTVSTFQLCVSKDVMVLLQKGQPSLAVGWFGPGHFEPEYGRRSSSLRKSILITNGIEN